MAPASLLTARQRPASLLLAAGVFAMAASELPDQEITMLQRVVVSGDRSWKLERYQNNHRGPIKMGMNPSCDDGHTNITLDWPDEMSLLCPTPKKPYPHIHLLSNRIECMEPPVDGNKEYMPDHYCMYTKLDYDETIPVLEGHRPVWPVFGEYFHVPRQRYLHSIEHGAIVMLYHPCAADHLVRRLRSLVTRCVAKYIISREPLLNPEMPLALAAWGCRMELNYIDDKAVTDFIKRHARKGPEGTLEKQGQYNYTIIRPAAYPPGMLANPNAPPEGQNMTVCPPDALQGHHEVYDDIHAAAIGVDGTAFSYAYDFLNDPNVDGSDLYTKVL